MDPQRSSVVPPFGGGNNTIRAAIMVVVMIVFSGYLFLWVMIPTNPYRLNWLPEIREQTTSTYFGTIQGATYLVFAFPILFIAVLGCVYVYLGKKSIDNHTKGEINGNNNNHRLAMWKRPMIIKGLGVVTRIEVAFFIMFIALLVWSFATYMRINFATITPNTAAKKGQLVWEVKLDRTSDWLAIVGNIAFVFLFFPVTRGSSVLPLFGLTSEGSVKYHIWLGHIVMTLFTAHSFGYVVYWASVRKLHKLLEWKKTGFSAIAGELSLVAGLVLWATTFPRIRRKMFEVFFYTHHMYIPFVVFFILHVGINYTTTMLPGFFLFLIDRYLRFLQSRSNVRLLSARVLPCQAVELNFSKTTGLRYSPTSIIFLNVPTISKMQWHPFTVSSSSSLESDKLSVIIKGEGKWSNKLYQMLSSSIDRLDVSTEGPYGPTSTDFLRHELLVMVSGGSGVTPFISIIRELIYTSENLKCKTPEILLITSFKNSNDLTLLDLILPLCGAPPEFPNLDLKIEAYVTRERAAPPKEQENTKIRTVWLKPNPSDAPISPILGPNSYLWLGAIISSSFIIYLIFIGILTRYTIYPIDRNTNKIYATSSRALIHMLFLCIGIFIAATSAFSMNKSKNAREIKTTQIQHMEGATPQASPNSSFYNADRELESLPQQSISQLINLHYGERPDLKRVLFERKESSVGVLVCGPKKMRHEVANICSSGLAANLHYESISFGW
ncbi:hypothetical protein ABFS82_02G166300 [Erythranthe guttata]|uniref:ferric-chelate reductase (NADH) n=1 Tax=Erythranthe guttata TaxID=4155 RepID=A0A022QW86_ERYGU|nr:hypothetical protein MIMGU_mgv1a024360mg [Erythranthe guttata]